MFIKKGKENEKKNKTSSEAVSALYAENVTTWAPVMKFYAWSEWHIFMPFKFLGDEHPRVHVK